MIFSGQAVLISLYLLEGFNGCRALTFLTELE
jgi:hypothetical protein